MVDSLKIKSFLLVSLGAIPGAILRWQIDEVFFANIIGCFLLGFVNNLSISSKSKLFFGFGFCGSLTTFSGWIFQLFKLMFDGLYLLFFMNIILNFIASLFAIYFGYLLAKKL